MQKNIYSILEEVREKKPVVHHLTNWVTIYDCAQVVKAFGASPVMAHAKEEAADMAKIASSLVLNIGTLTVDFVDSMKLAAKSANEKKIPVILDVCGAGATPFRDKKCFELLKEVHIDVIKGNASEIARIAGENVATKGVDSGDVSKDIAKIAAALARERSCVVAVTGKEDIISDGNVLYKVCNGHPVMARVVGTGCMAASVIGTFCAVESNLAFAACAGLVCYEIAAEIAAKKCGGPGSFKEAMFDEIAKLDKAAINKMKKIERIMLPGI